MAIQFHLPEPTELTPRIVVFGVGGAGGNAVNNMIEQELEGVEFIAANTDSQALQQSKAEHRIQLGSGVTSGLGAGGRPALGEQAAEESVELIRDVLTDANMCFITAGMGGGTGTGAAPVIARAAREQGVLTVGVVTKPFAFEGAKRMRIAEGGIQALQDEVDTLIVIPNQNLFRIANERTTFAEAFVLADDVLHQGVKGVTDLMVRPGIVNLDFADVRAVMDEMGKAMMGSGEASGERRAIEAAEAAIDNPLLDEVTLKGARGVLINITGGLDLKLFEVDEAANRIRKEADPEAAVFFGSAIDPDLDGRIRVSVVATGIDAAKRVEQPTEDLAAAHGSGQAAHGAAAPRPAAEPAQAPAQEPAPMSDMDVGSATEDRAAAARAASAPPQTPTRPAHAFEEPHRPAAPASASWASDPGPRAAEPAAETPAPRETRIREDEIDAVEAEPVPEPDAGPPRDFLVKKLAGRIRRGGADDVEEAQDKPRVDIPSFLRRQAT